MNKSGTGWTLCIIVTLLALLSACVTDKPEPSTSPEETETPVNQQSSPESPSDTLPTTQETLPPLTTIQPEQTAETAETAETPVPDTIPSGSELTEETLPPRQAEEQEEQIVDLAEPPLQQESPLASDPNRINQPPSGNFPIPPASNPPFPPTEDRPLPSFGEPLTSIPADQETPGDTQSQLINPLLLEQDNLAEPTDQTPSDNQAQSTLPTPNQAQNQNQEQNTEPATSPESANQNNQQPTTSSPAEPPPLTTQTPDEALPSSPTTDNLTDPGTVPDQTLSLQEPGEITIILPGRGWVFRSDLSSRGGWTFLDRERQDDSTRFRFLFTENGNWNLVFGRQDLETGQSEQEVRRIQIGQNDNSAQALSDSSPAENSDQRNQLARQQLENGNPREAMELWQTDALLDDEAGIRARAGLMEAALSLGDASDVLDSIPAYLEDGADPDTVSALLDLLEESHSEQVRPALETLATGPGNSTSPEWLFRLASTLEAPGENRNLERAASLYAQITEQWPLSDWADNARKRLAWLDRYYFRIR